MTPFDWRNFLDLADWLGERVDTDEALAANDAALRTVISRSYYAAFHVARAFVRSKVREGVLRWPGTGRSIHDQVWEVLQQYPDDGIVALALKGANLKRDRTEADYSIAPNKRRARIASDARRNAGAIIRGLDESVANGLKPPGSSSST